MYVSVSIYIWIDEIKEQETNIYWILTTVVK